MVIPTSDSPVKRHNSSNRAINLFGGLFLVCFNVSGRVGSDIDVVHISPQNRVTAVGYFLFKHKFHQFLCGR